MSLPRRSSMVSFVTVFALTVAPAIARASDELTTKVRTAWEKYSEREEINLHYGERARIALTMLELDRQRIAADAAALELKVEIDTFPRRRNNLQDEVFHRWQELGRQRDAFAAQIGELRLQWQELNETAIQEAQAAGKRVKPLDRPGLLNELQRLDRECQNAFGALKNVLPDAARAQGVTEVAAFKNAINEVGGAKDPRVRLVPSTQFADAFNTFYNQQSSEQPKQSGRMKRRKRSGG